MYRRDMDYHSRRKNVSGGVEQMIKAKFKLREIRFFNFLYLFEH